MDFSTVPMTQSFHTRSCFHRLCSMHVCCKKRHFLGRRGRWFVDFSTVHMTQSFHTRSCFHRLCSMQVCSKKRQLWVDSGDGLWILVPFPWPKNFILGLVITAYIPCCKKPQLWVDRGDGLWILVPFPWPKVFILGLVFTAYVPCTYAVKNKNFGSTGAMVCGF